MEMKLLAIPIILFFVLPALVTANIQELELNDLYNYTGTNSSTPTFNFRVLLNESSGSVNCTLLINDTGYGVNNTVVNNTETNITTNSSLSDGLYTWGMNCTTNDSINIETYTRLFWVDTQPPNVTLVDPTPNATETIEATNRDYIITVNATYSDNSEIITCFLTRNSVEYPMTVYNNYCEVSNTEWTEGQNTIKVRAFDKGGNYGDSSERIFIYDAITRADNSSIYWLFPIVLIAVAAITALGIFAIFDVIDLEKTVYLMLIVMFILIFAGVLISMGGEVI